MIDSDTVGPVKIDLGACTCTLPVGVVMHPDGDYALIARHAPYQMGLAALEVVSEASEPVGLGVSLREVYVVWGVVGWNLVDEKGAAIPVTRAAIREQFMVNWSPRTIDLAESCALQYNDEVMLPLQERALRRLGSGPTDKPISPNRASRRDTAKRSQPSSHTNLAAGSTSEVQAR